MRMRMRILMLVIGEWSCINLNLMLTNACDGYNNIYFQSLNFNQYQIMIGIHDEGERGKKVKDKNSLQNYIIFT